MNELVMVENNQVVVSSRQVAENFGKEHSKVIRSIEGIANFGDTQGMFHKVSYINEQNGQEYKEYLMNRDGFSLLVMGFTGKEAMTWKIKYIQAFNEMEAKIRENTLPMPNFNNPAEAARAWANEYEAKQKALAEVNEMKPKAEFYDDVTGSTDTIDIGNVAKVLNVPNVGRNKLFAFLRKKNILNHRNEPYQEYVDRGYFRQIETSWERDGTTHINLKTVVFQKGLDFIRKLLIKEAEIELI